MKRRNVLRLTRTIRIIQKHAFGGALIVTGLFLAVAFLSRLPAGSAAVEHIAATDAASWQAMSDNPIYIPYKIVVFAVIQISHSILAVRAVSLLVFIATAAALYYALKHWHTKAVALLTTSLFATNALVLGVSRFGTPLVTVFGWFLFAALLLWQVHGKSNKIIPTTMLVATASLLYIPGAPWFFGIFLFFYWKRFKRAFSGVKTGSIVIGTSLGLIIALPLLIGFIRNPNTAVEWLLLPPTFSLRNIYTSLLEVPSAYIYKFPSAPLINVARLPIFDLASGFLFLIGLHAYRKKMQLDRTRLMIAIAVVACVIGALGQAVIAAVLLLPFGFSIIAAGIEYLIDEWYGVFPKNPFARSFGLLVVSAVVLFGMYYQLTRFLVVWPQSSETRMLYKEERIIR